VTGAGSNTVHAPPVVAGVDPAMTGLGRWSSPHFFNELVVLSRTTCSGRRYRGNGVAPWSDVKHCDSFLISASDLIQVPGISDLAENDDEMWKIL